MNRNGVRSDGVYRNVSEFYGHNVEDIDRDDRFHSALSDATAKINYTIRF